MDLWRKGMLKVRTIFTPGAVSSMLQCFQAQAPPTWSLCGSVSGFNFFPSHFSPSLLYLFPPFLPFPPFLFRFPTLFSHFLSSFLCPLSPLPHFPPFPLSSVSSVGSRVVPKRRNARWETFSPGDYSASPESAAASLWQSCFQFCCEKNEDGWWHLFTCNANEHKKDMVSLHPCYYQRPYFY